MRVLLIILGSIALVAGIVGIFLPLVPTTPFLLLAAALYARSSPRLYGWLLNNKRLGPYIRNYREHRAIPLRAKVVSLVLMWGSMIYCIFWVVEDRLWAQLLLGAVAVGVSIHILSFKTLKK